MNIDAAADRLKALGWSMATWPIMWRPGLLVLYLAT